MPNILITGAASGLGQCFLQDQVQRIYTRSLDSTNTITEDWHIYAIDRDSRINSWEFWNDLVPQRPGRRTPFEGWVKRHVTSIVLDITDTNGIEELFSANGELGGVSLDLVLHSAGIRGLVDDGRAVQKYKDVKGTESIDVMNKHTLMKTFEINVAGTFELLRACVSGLKTAANNRASTNDSPPKVIVMGSRMGSISNNARGNVSAGGAYAYRASKAALNAVVRSFAVDVPEAIWTIVHPGRVETGLVRVKEDGAMSVEESVGDMMRLIKRLEREDSGRFVDRLGEDIPW